MADFQLDRDIKEWISWYPHKGFDELANDTGLTKKEIKKYWNELALGWRMFPRTQIDITRISKGNYRLLNEVVMYIAEGMPVVIPEGFVFDFASVPRPLWWIISPDDDGIALPGLLHDELYATEMFSRRVCDGLFLQAMNERGLLPVWKRQCAYWAVRLGGWLTWRNHDPAEVRKQKNILLARTESYRKQHATTSLSVK